MRLLLLTGGGHIDFSDALITVMNAQRERGNEVLASLDGWKNAGKMDGTLVDITNHSTEFLRIIGGSFLGSARENPDLNLVEHNVKKYGIDVILAHGGEDTLGAARKVHEAKKIPIVGWPKTMDNDTNGGYSSIGYTTAAEIAATQTYEAFRNAYSHSRVVLVVMFGRTYDWVVGAAADYGLADAVIPAERKGLTLEQIGTNIKNVYFGNKEKYGKPFAVVAVSEGAVEIKGLGTYMERAMHGKKIKYDKFGHPKLEPEILGIALKDAISDYTGLDSSSIALKLITYHLRDPNLNELDRKFAIMTAEECVRLIDRGKFGRVATIQDPEYSGFKPNDSSLIVNANGKELYVGSVSLDEASRVRPVTGTGFFDYEQLRTTPAFSRYLHTLLGARKPNPREFIHQFKPAAHLELMVK